MPEAIEERIDLAETQCYEWQINRLDLPKGSHSIVCYFREVSERVKTQHRLRQSESRYRELFNSIDEGYCVVEMLFDEDDKPIDYLFLEVNAAFEQQSGLHGATGKRMRELAPEHEDHWYATYGKVVKTGEPIRVIQHAKALERWFDLYAFRLGEPESHKVAVVFNDITSRLESEKALKESEERYRSLFNKMTDLHRQKDEFLAMLSHELRNPMAPLASATEVLRLSKLDDPLQQQACSIIERQVGNLKVLVDDLLEVSRLTTGRVRLRTERIAIADIIRRAVETTEPLVKARRHTFELRVPTEPAWIHGDSARLEQVVVNLLANAAKYTPEGGRIWLTVEPGPERVLLRVRDTGVGIGADLLPHVFDLFRQAERSLDRAEGGLGIGLSVARRLVGLHGGELTVASEVGKGSEFVVTLPAMLEPATAAQPRAPIGRPATIDQGRDQKQAQRVLVVDDNVDGAEILNVLLTASGHEGLVAHDGVDALRAAHDFKPDVVLLDIGLPKLDGYEVARRMREDPAMQGLLLIAMTGYGQEADRRRTEEAGFDHHLVKPVNFAEIERILSAGSREGGCGDGRGLLV
jgi:signal transduction histidine kinase/ActR/RegA family two-component response regulator